MNLKKEMEKDLEFYEKLLKEVEELLDNTFHEESRNILAKDIVTKKVHIDLIKKYLKYFADDTVVEIRRKYKLKEERKIEYYCQIQEWFEDLTPVTVVQIISIVDYNVKLKDIEFGNIWILDINTFENMFEEVME